LPANYRFLSASCKSFSVRGAGDRFRFFAEMFCRPASALPGCWVDIPLFCRRKKFSTKTRYTIRRRAIIFPHVENPVEKVQKSSFKACFACGIPHFPQGFPLFGSTFLISCVQFVEYKSEI
jgi:hypothetical protein